MSPRNSAVAAVLDATATFRPVPFAVPLVLSSGPIHTLTEARVEVEVRTVAGHTGRGHGSVLLSHPWIYGRRPTGADPDAVLRAVVHRLVDSATDLPTPADPLRLGHELARAVPGILATVRAEFGLADPIPELAGPVCVSPLDAALHDAWAAALGRPAYRCYTAEFCDTDLAAYLGPAFTGTYPGDFLRREPRTRLPVQHVVGVTDPLTPAEGVGSLAERIAAEGTHWFKIKLSGADPSTDADRVRAVYDVARASLPDDIAPLLSLDPNEGFPGPDELSELLRALESASPAALTAVRYAEQPFRRESQPDPDALTRLTERLPVVVDEGLIDASALDGLAADGWSGLALKTGRGHTQCLLGYCWARRHGRFVTMQDLTAVGDGLLHSAALASWLDDSTGAFECNSLQYAPAGNIGAAADLSVRRGELDLSVLPRKGIR